MVSRRIKKLDKRFKRNHEYGFTIPYLKEILTEKEQESLFKFMYGQTMMYDERLDCGVIYEHDLENWINNGRLFWD